MKKILNNANEAVRNITYGNYSNALVHVHNLYNSFYEHKRKIIKRYPDKSFKQIANSDCRNYKEYRESFYLVDEKAFNALKNIERYAIKNDKNFINIDGDDLLKKTNILRKHCKMFAELRIVCESE